VGDDKCDKQVEGKGAWLPAGRRAARQRGVGSVHFHNTRNICSLLIGRSAVAMLLRGRLSSGVHLSATTHSPCLPTHVPYSPSSLRVVRPSATRTHTLAQVLVRRRHVTTSGDMSRSNGGGGSSAIWRVAQETVSDQPDTDETTRQQDARRTVSPASDTRALPLNDDRKSDSSAAEPEIAASSAATAAPETLEDSPTRRRNKRKMTEPRRRATDFSIRSICSSSNSDVERDNDDDDDKSTGDSSVAKIWKPGNVFDASPTTTTTAATNTFNFYPLNIPIIHNLHHSIGSIAARYAATTTPTTVRPASCESSLGSSGDHDRSTQADDTSSPGGRRSPSAGTRSASDRPRRQSAKSQSSASTVPADGDQRCGSRAGSPRKNYKNMTKQRRIEANARERTRVHTISAAFESLRRAVPSYSYNQRLSKLAILRIACSYILALARLADLDYSSTSAGDRPDEQMSFAECVDLCTQTIQSEGRAKRRH